MIKQTLSFSNPAYLSTSNAQLVIKTPETTKHIPVGMFLNLDGNTLQSNRFQTQIEASEPLKKSLCI